MQEEVAGLGGRPCRARVEELLWGLGGRAGGVRGRGAWWSEGEACASASSGICLREG